MSPVFRIPTSNLSGKDTGDRVKDQCPSSGRKAQSLCDLWANYVTSPSLHFLISKMRTTLCDRVFARMKCEYSHSLGRSGSKYLGIKVFTSQGGDYRLRLTRVIKPLRLFSPLVLSPNLLVSSSVGFCFCCGYILSDCMDGELHVCQPTNVFSRACSK